MKRIDIEHFPAHIIEWDRKRDEEQIERDDNARRIPLYAPEYDERNDEENHHEW